MVMFRTILVPLDGFPFGEHAVPLAASIARRCGSALHLVHVHVPQEVALGEPVLFMPPGVDEAIKEQQQKYLQELSARVRGLNAAPTCTVLQGGIAPTIEKHVVDIGADLVVLTTHGRGAISRTWFGSIADDLMRRLNCPVLLTRPENSPANPAADVALKRMLIALDGSPLSEQILEPATELAQAFQAQCTLVRVLPPLIRGQSSGPADMAYSTLDAELLEKLQQLHQQDHRAAETYLQGRATQLQTRIPKVTGRLLDHEQPAAALLEQADKISADLIALATHGRGGIPRLFLGSVADKVARGAHCPILVYRPRRV